jgi:hypothetical protein
MVKEQRSLGTKESWDKGVFNMGMFVVDLDGKDEEAWEPLENQPHAPPKNPSNSPENRFHKLVQTMGRGIEAKYPRDV